MCELSFWDTFGWFIFELFVIFRKNAKGLCCEVYGKGGPQIWLDNVECFGTESDIFHCQHIGWGNHNCDNHEDAAVQCYPSGTGTTRTKKLKIPLQTQRQQLFTPKKCALTISN